MAGEPAGLIGRATECSSILAALGVNGANFAAVVLTGEAGSARQRSGSRSSLAERFAGDHVLVSRATAAEARLPWVGLTDLLRSIPLTVQARLPDVQQRALKAVSLQQGGAEVLDERTVGTAMLSALRAMTESAPVLLAVDDLPYLDVASAVRRRFRPAPPGRDRTRRGCSPPSRGRDAAVAGGIAACRADRSTAIGVGPLTLGALFALLQARGGIRLPRPLLLRVHETAGGNPLYALELARALDRLEISPKAGSPLPVPVGLDALVDARVRDLRTGCRRARRRDGRQLAFQRDGCRHRGDRAGSCGRDGRRRRAGRGWRTSGGAGGAPPSQCVGLQQPDRLPSPSAA